MRVIISLTSLDGGGTERILYDYCSRISSSVEFDFVIIEQKEGILEKYVRQFGANIYRVPSIRRNPIKHIKNMKDILKKGRYDIIHTNGGYKSFTTLLIAKSIGIKTRIAHSHLANVPLGFIERIEKLLFTPLTKKVSTDFFACSKDAALWAWGEKLCESGRVKILKNGIDIKKFVFSSSERELIRKKLRIEDKFVVGFVGRLSYQKNSEFLIEIFNKITTIKNNAILLIIGDGEDYSKIKKKVDDLQLQSKVIMLGKQTNVNEWLNSFDVFVLPSRYEGLGIVFIEAQTNGLICFASEEGVPREASVGTNLHYISLLEPPLQWAEEICAITEDSNSMRESAYKAVQRAGYDIELESNKLLTYYQEAIKSTNHR